MNPVVYGWFVQNIPALTPVEFQETQGKLLSQKSLPELWCTVEWENGSRQRLTVGKRAIWREYGTATAVFVGKAGYGPAAVLAAAQQFADAVDVHEVIAGIELTEANDITGTMRIENVGTPNPEPYEDGNWLVCSVSCVYTYDSVRGAVG